MPKVERIYDEAGDLTHRTCNGPLCEGKLMEASNFHKDKSKKDKLYIVCKNCVRHKKGQTKMQIRKREFDAEGNLIACECLGPLCNGKMHLIEEYWIVPGKQRVIGHCIACRKQQYEEENPTPQQTRVERYYDDQDNLTHKQCFGPECIGEVRPIGNFTKNKAMTDGLESWCRACRKVHQTKYKDKRKAYSKTEQGKASQKKTDASRRGKYNAMRNKLLREKRMNSLPYTLNMADLDHALAYFDEVCPVCQVPQNRSLDQDHWIPVISNDCPGTVSKNIVFMCRSCNRSKGTSDPYEFYQDRPDVIERIEAFFETVRK